MLKSSPLNLSLTQPNTHNPWVWLASGQALGLLLKDTEYNSANKPTYRQLQNSQTEMGLWNNSWVKNLPVRPLAPRRKTAGQQYPIFDGPPGKTN